jgi:hypothetical protein
VGTIIKFLAGTEMAGGGEKSGKIEKRSVFVSSFFPKGDMERR